MRAIDEFGVGVLIRRVIERVKARNACCMSASMSIFWTGSGSGRRHHGAGRSYLSRGASRHGAITRFGLGASVDIVELNPFLDQRGRTARIAVELIGSLFGLQITDRPTPSNAVFPDDI